MKPKKDIKDVIVMSDEHNQTYLPLYLAGTIPVVWIALLLAPYLFNGSVFVHLSDMTNALNNPLSVTWTEDSLKTIFLFLCIYASGIGIYYSTKKNYRRGEEHGSAKWGSIKKVNKKYSSKKSIEDKILTQNVRISYNSRNHRRNLLTLVCGGSGAGKTRFYAKPNLLQGNTSFVVLDPKGGARRSYMKSVRTSQI